MNDILILASLLDGPKHGYLIKKQAGLILRGGELHNNLVYPLLHRFERCGWLGKRKSRGERGQTRQEYFLTAAGKAEIIRRLEHYPDSEDSNEAFYLRAGLFDLLPHQARLSILRERERELERVSEQLGRISLELGPKGYGGEVLSFLQRKTRFELKWVRTLNLVPAHSRRRAASQLRAPKNGKAGWDTKSRGRGEA
jgi:DNA-binding PadR family transcriptional regulator